jgi:hypothetical protein
MLSFIRDPQDINYAGTQYRYKRHIGNRKYRHKESIIRLGKVRTENST